MLKTFGRLIQLDKVRFSYTGWTPRGALRASGSSEAVRAGFLHEFNTSYRRLADDVAHQYIAKADALIDLKIHDRNGECLRATGNFGLSRSLVMPLIAHKHAYPNVPCIIFSDYDELSGRILDGRLLQEILVERSIILDRRSTLERRNISTLSEMLGR
jgi:hypothetical protein